MDRDRWASDTPVSAPVPDDSLGQRVQADLGGFIFTPAGIALPVNRTLYEDRYQPLWASQERRGRRVE